MGDRDSNGRFLPSHNIKSPGRPPRAVEEKVLAAVVKAFASNGNLDINLIEPWTKQTRRGSSELIKLAMAYLVGSPEQVVKLRGEGPNGEIVIDLVRQVIGEARDHSSDPSPGTGPDSE